MTPDIEQLAKEAGLNTWQLQGDPGVYWAGTPGQLAKFANLMAEECAKEAEATFNPRRDFKGTNLYFERCARAIRAKFALSNYKPEAK